MADFFMVTTKRMSISNKVPFEPAPNVPNNTNNKVAHPRADTSVGATGDSVPNNTNNKATLPRDVHRVGETGDNAAKKGSGK